MRVTFDSNVWELVVRPHAHKASPHHADLQTVQDAIRSGEIRPYISETFATVEAIKRRVRFEYLEDRPIPINIEWSRGTGNNIKGVISIAANSENHPGLMPILRDKLSDAFAMGFKSIPSTRLGTLRPPELENESNRIELTEEHNRDIWVLMQRIDDVSSAIESRGVGMAQLKAIARRIQSRHNFSCAAWYDGLNLARDDAEKREIASAFSEWADGDSVALHIGYELDIFCTQDYARPGGPSVFDDINRAWISETYSARFMSIAELAASVRP